MKVNYRISLFLCCHTIIIIIIILIRQFIRRRNMSHYINQTIEIIKLSGEVIWRPQNARKPYSSTPDPLRELAALPAGGRGLLPYPRTHHSTQLSFPLCRYWIHHCSKPTVSINLSHRRPFPTHRNAFTFTDFRLSVV